MTVPQSLWAPMGIMLISGTCNTILMKFLVRQEASPGLGLAPIGFDFPFFQTMIMMMGEVLCLGAYFSTAGAKGGKTTFPTWIMLLPVSCDWTATTLVNAAYVYCPASTIQMCRGCIVIFTCALSVLVLKRKQETFHYVGVALVALGITIVSLEAVLVPAPADPSIAGHSAWIGIALCLAGQLFQSSMLVIEERYLSSYTVPPLQMVGLEGAFGCVIGIFLLAALQPLGIESTTQAVYMMHQDVWIQVGCIASMFSIAFFNWSGVTVTSGASAVARSTIDVSRTTLIWAVELALAWNTFSWLQFCGFVVLITGTLVYNGIIALPMESERKALLP